jgi:hypothetical protein
MADGSSPKKPTAAKPRAVKRSRYRTVLENLAQSSGTLAETAKWALDEIRKGRLRSSGGVDVEALRRSVIDETIRIVEGEAEPTVAGSRLEMEKAEAVVEAVRGTKRSLVRRLIALRELELGRFP